MPVDPGFGERLARRVSTLYAQAELVVLRLIRDRVARGMDAPDWAEQKALQLEALRREIAEQLAATQDAGTKELLQVILDAASAGEGAAAADLAALGIDAPVLSPAAQAAVQQIAAETTWKLHALPALVLRASTDAYQRVVAQAASTVVLGAQTRRQAAQQAMDGLLGRGIGGFTDSAGRRWQLASYVEMAVRTGAGGAAIQGHVATLSASGLDLVLVSDAPRECPLCRPWEGKVLSISGQSVGTVEVRSATTGQPVKVHVAGSVAEARAAGFQHPNCRHSLNAYVPGAAIAPKPRSSPEGYEAQQRQRALERGIRTWKMREAIALDEPARRAAAAKVSEWQAALRAHLSENPELKRQSAREQIGKAR